MVAPQTPLRNTSMAQGEGRAKEGNLERFSKQLIQRFRELQPSGVRVPGRIQKRRNSLRDQFF
jgi:hypothetical protein